MDSSSSEKEKILGVDLGNSNSENTAVGIPICFPSALEVNSDIEISDWLTKTTDLIEKRQIDFGTTYDSYGDYYTKDTVYKQIPTPYYETTKVDSSGLTQSWTTIAPVPLTTIVPSYQAKNKSKEKQEDEPTTALGCFIKHYADKAFVTDRGHSPIPMSSLEEVFRDIKFVLVEFREKKNRWKSDQSVQFDYFGTYCFFTREKDSFFENTTFKYFDDLQRKHSFEIKAVGKMSCLMTADLIFDPFADLVRKEFFKQFPNGEFDSRSMKLNQRIFFVKTESELRRHTTVLRQNAGTPIYSINSNSTYSRSSYKYDYDCDPTVAIVYIDSRGLNVFAGIEDEFGSFTKEWLYDFLKIFFPAPKKSPIAELSSKKQLEWDDATSVGIEAIRLLSFPDLTTPSSYFSSSALMLMLLTNFLATYPKHNPTNEITVEKNELDEVDAKFFSWIFKEWWLMKDENIFKAVASACSNGNTKYWAETNISLESSLESRISFVRKFGIPVDLTGFEKDDEFLEKEALRIVDPQAIEKREERTISSR